MHWPRAQLQLVRTPGLLVEASAHTVRGTRCDLQPPAEPQTRAGWGESLTARKTGSRDYLLLASRKVCKRAS